MPDQITVKDEGKSLTPCPEGSRHAVCVDVIDLGETMESYQGNPPERKHKIALVFQAAEQNPDTGKPFEPSIEFTASFGPKANLRKFLANWRGKPYTDEEARSGAPLHKLVGVNAIINVQHKTSAAGRLYAIIASIAPPMKGMVKLAPTVGYERSEHWGRRKQEYRTLVAAQASVQASPFGAPNFDEVPEPLQAEDDDLPFNWER